MARCGIRRKGHSRNDRRLCACVVEFQKRGRYVSHRPAAVCVCDSVHVVPADVKCSLLSRAMPRFFPCVKRVCDNINFLHNTNKTHIASFPGPPHVYIIVHDGHGCHDFPYFALGYLALGLLRGWVTDWTGHSAILE